METERLLGLTLTKCWLLSDFSFGELAYCRCGHTMADHTKITAPSEQSHNYRLTMNSNRLAVFEASLQCTGEMKVILTGMHKSRTLVTLFFGSRVNLVFLIANFAYG